MSEREDRAIQWTKRATPRASAAPGGGTVRARFDRLIARMDELASTLAKPLSEHRIFAFVLAYEHSLSSADLAAAVLALEPSPLFDQFERLRHRAAAYRLLYDLAKLRLLAVVKSSTTRIPLDGSPGHLHSQPRGGHGG